MSETSLRDSQLLNLRAEEPGYGFEPAVSRRHQETSHARFAPRVVLNISSTSLSLTTSCLLQPPPSITVKIQTLKVCPHDEVRIVHVGSSKRTVSVCSAIDLAAIVQGRCRMPSEHSL